LNKAIFLKKYSYCKVVKIEKFKYQSGLPIFTMADSNTENTNDISSKFKEVDNFLKIHSDKTIKANELNAALKPVMPHLDEAAEHIPGGASALKTWKDAYERTSGKNCQVTYHYLNWTSLPVIQDLTINGIKNPDACYTSNQMVDIATGIKVHSLPERIFAGLAAIVDGSFKTSIRGDDQYMKKFYAHLQKCDSCRYSFAQLTR
jgi:hypothetical protein